MHASPTTDWPGFSTDVKLSDFFERLTSTVTGPFNFIFPPDPLCTFPPLR